MIEHFNAIFENGVFRPEVPVNLADGQRVSLRVTSQSAICDDLSDVVDLLDTDYVASCRQRAKCTPSLEDVRSTLSAFAGSLADRISEERDER